jgi:hypothetical protein
MVWSHSELIKTALICTTTMACNALTSGIRTALAFRVYSLVRTLEELSSRLRVQGYSISYSERRP